MTASTPQDLVRTSPEEAIGLARKLSEKDLDELCEATAQAVEDGQDIAWIERPAKSVLQAYWKGILLAPHRHLFLVRHEGRIVGAAQLILPGAINEAGAHAGEIATFFVAPAARGHGYARALFEAIEAEALREELLILDFSIRADREAGIRLVERLGYVRWAEKPHYAYIHGAFHRGFFYSKTLSDADKTEQTA